MALSGLQVAFHGFPVGFGGLSDFRIPFILLQLVALGV